MSALRRTLNIIILPMSSNHPTTPLASGRQDVCPTHDHQASSPPILQNPNLKIKKRKLPHWELDGAVYFLTFTTWDRLQLTEAARQVVLNACLFFNHKRFEIFSMVVMPDHVHIMIQPWAKSPTEYWSLSSIMHSIKSYSAKQIPKVMKHMGTVWAIEWHDRIIRDDQEFQNTWEYIRQNPVKAGLSATPEVYPFLWESGREDNFV